MISEEKLRELSYKDAPKIVTDEIPGPKSRKILEEVPKYESMIRPPGMAAPPVFDEAMGGTVKDPDSNIYIDMGAGVAVTNVGRRHPRVLRAIEEQCKKILHAGEVTNPRRSELAKRIAGIMPEGLRNNCVTYFALSGSGAIETTIKLVRHITGRDKLVAFHGAYHGVWCGSLSLTATAAAHAGGWGSLIPNVIHLPYAYCYRCPFGLDYPACGIQCGKYVDHVLNTPGTAGNDIAAVIVEPLQAEGGYVPPPVEFLHMVKAAAHKCGALFVSDEIQSGMGRTGKMWAIEHADIVPDILVWGKAMGGDLPMAGVTFRAELEERLKGTRQPQTFAGNALSCAVSITNIDILTDEGDALIERADQVGHEIRERLWKALENCRLVGDVRGRGFMIGIELVKDKESKEPVEFDLLRQILGGILKDGVIAYPCGRYMNVLRLMPALTIPKEYLNKAIDIIVKRIKEAESDRVT